MTKTHTTVILLGMFQKFLEQLFLTQKYSHKILCRKQILPGIWMISSKWRCTFTILRNSHLEMFCKKGVLKNVAKFTGSHLCRSLYLLKFQTCNCIKKETPTQSCLVNFAKFLRTPFSTEYLGGCLLILKKFKYIAVIHWGIANFHLNSWT